MVNAMWLSLDSGEPAALQVGVGKTAALQLWRGQGAVELLRADPRRGVLLLEWLDRPLTEASSEEACQGIARL